MPVGPSSAARAALRAYPIDVASVRLVADRLSTTFRVHDRGGAAYALKMGRPGIETEDTARSEMHWLRWLGDAPALVVPHVIERADGDLVSSGDDESGERWGSVVTWLAGRKRRAVVSTRDARAMGRLLARLHVRARTFDPQAGFTRKVWDARRMCGRFGPSDVLAGQVEPAHERMVRRWEDRVAALHGELSGRSDAHGMIVADFGPHNIVWDGEHPRLVDFNDSGWGLYAYDLAIVVTGLERRARGDALAAALLDGYQEVSGLPPGFDDSRSVRATALVRRLRWEAGKPGAPLDGLFAQLAAIGPP